ncbi:MAG: RnfABCDGE type electron transport complex subunit B [Candidatus Izimaplasma sp.]|nr:RnfABCDGE type electron transport complex subunit B [Candidatus Izimaplasma bacterium]
MLDIILIGASISFVIAVILSISSVVFHVDEDPRIDDITKLLPNQNCGQCGNPSCKAMATAILDEDAKLTQCKPGDEEMRQEIKEYLETHPDEDGEFTKVKM